MSSKKRLNLPEGYKYDDDGKIIALPLKLPVLAEAYQKCSGKKQIQKRKFIPIEPLDMSALFSGQKPKNRKLEEPEFREPEKKVGRRLTVNSRKAATIKPKTVIPSISPIFSLEVAEKNIRRKIDFQSNKENLITSTTPSKKCQTIEEVATPSSSESNSEFLMLEQQLASAKKSIPNLSPMSSMCTLMESTNIGSPTNDIRKLLEETQKEIFDLKKQVLMVEQRCQSRMNKILELLQERSGSRRSVRLAVKNKCVTSPALGEKTDLRKTTLAKNLSKRIQYEESPRSTNAMKLFNGMRATNSGILSTPRIDGVGLSSKIRDQCWRLQDTPVAKD